MCISVYFDFVCVFCGPVHLRAQTVSHEGLRYLCLSNYQLSRCIVLALFQKCIFIKYFSENSNFQFPSFFIGSLSNSSLYLHLKGIIALNQVLPSPHRGLQFKIFFFISDNVKSMFRDVGTRTFSGFVRVPHLYQVRRGLCRYSSPQRMRCLKSGRKRTHHDVP